MLIRKVGCRGEALAALRAMDTRARCCMWILLLL